MFCNLSIIRFITILESSRSLLSEYISRRVLAKCFLTSFSQAKRVGVSRVYSSVTEAVYSSWRRPCKFIEYVLLRVLLRGNYVHFGINLLVVVPTTLRSV